MIESSTEFRRRRAVELMQQGEDKEIISRILGVSRNSLNVWLKKTNAGESLKTKPISGRPRRIDIKQLAELEQLLSKGATFHGWQNNLWTTLRVREVIKKHFGILFCRSHVWHILTDYLHWSAIRPAQQAAKRDDKEINRWKSDEYPKIVKQARRRNSSLVFVDESGFMMTPTIRRTFAPCGSTPVNKVSDPHGRISVMGAIAVHPNRTVNLHFCMLGDNLNFRGPSVIEFLKQLRNEVNGPMTIVWDQIIIHSSEVVLDYLKLASEVVTESFPPYAPELNPVDKAWFFLKYARLPNYTPSKMAQLRCTVEEELKCLQNKPDLLRSFIRQSGLPVVS